MTTLSVACALVAASACKPGSPAPAVDVARAELAVPRWQQVPIQSPSRRIGVGMAYDALRGKMVLFGGTISSGSYFSDTWEWNGSEWTRIAEVGPPARAFHAMTYDAQRQRVVMHGGKNLGNNALADQWEWDGQTWTQLPSGPARTSHALARDSATQALVLFGGLDAQGSPSGQTWRFTGGAWTQASSTGPPARSNHAMAYDPTLARVVLYGGDPNFYDTWFWNDATSTWTQPAPPLITARSGPQMATDGSGVTHLVGGNPGTAGGGNYYLHSGGSGWQAASSFLFAGGEGHAMAYQPSTMQLIIYGGSFGPSKTSVGYFGSWQNLQLSGPGDRFYHAMANDENTGPVVLYGGSSGVNVTDETWFWDGSQWTFYGGGPTARMGHSMTWDPQSSAILMFGGVDGSGADLSDLWAFDLQNGWSLVDSHFPGAPRSFHQAIAAEGIVCFHGGEYQGSLVEDSWCWENGGWVSVSGPLPRSRAAATYNPTNGIATIFGGMRNGVRMGDTWTSEGVSYGWIQEVDEPGPRSGHSLTYSPADGAVVLFGGGAPGLWKVRADGGWTQISNSASNGPGARALQTLAADTATGKLTVFGGRTLFDGQARGDTWTWNGGIWREIVDLPPSAQSPTMGYDAARAETVLIADGLTYIWNGERWRRSAGSAPANQSNARMAYDPLLQRLMLHGPTGTYAWNGATWTGVVGAGPGARYGVGLVTTPSGVLLQGGQDTGGLRKDDVWLFGPNEFGSFTWRQLTVNGSKPSARSGHSFVWDSARGRAVLFGGYDGAARDDTWELTVSGGTTAQWTSIAESGPPARSSAGAAYDATRGRTVLFGGTAASGSTSFDDTWEWDGSHWQNLGSLGPSARTGAQLVFDRDQRQVLLFGGASAPNDTWRFSVRGNPCVGGWQCNSGFCTDGVCCDRFACGTCERCDQAGHDGICTPVTGADDDTCVAPKVCVVDVSGASSVGLCGFARGDACAVDGDCHSGHCVDGLCCDSACTGECQTCSRPDSPGTCLPIPAEDHSTGRNAACAPYRCNGTTPFCPPSCTGDASCDEPFYCATTSTCEPRRALGQFCNVRVGPGALCLQGGCRVCESGFCADSVCCDVGCSGGCETCLAARGAPSDGTCSTVSPGQVGRVDCGLYLCSGDPTCPTACDSDGDCRATSGSAIYCIAGICQGSLPNGLACANAGECASGICVDGLCCDSACDGECVACNVAGSEGTCALTPLAEGADCDGHSACRGQCAGTSTADAHCSYPLAGTRCEICLTCDGEGACTRPPDELNDNACPSIDCRVLDTECRSYRNSATGRCLAAGSCATADDTSSCRNFDDVADDTPCSSGLCRAGQCVAPPTNERSGCEISSPRASGSAAWAWLAFGMIAAWRARERRSIRRLT